MIFENWVLWGILLILVIGFLPGMVSVVGVVASGMDTANPAYLAVMLIPVALFVLAVVKPWLSSAEA